MQFQRESTKTFAVRAAVQDFDPQQNVLVCFGFGFSGCKKAISIVLLLFYCPSFIGDRGQTRLVFTCWTGVAPNPACRDCGFSKPV